MDFEIIVWLIIIFFILLRFLGRKPQPQKREEAERRQPQAGAGEGPSEGSLEDALREIREALGGAPPREKERPAPPQQQRPAQRPSAQRPAEQSRERESFHDTVLVDRTRAQQPRPQRSAPKRPAPPPPPKGGTRSMLERQAELAERAKGQKIGETPIIDEVMKAYDRRAHDKRGVRKDDILPMVSSRRALKQAMKVREVLGPCRAKNPFSPTGRGR